MDPRGDVLGRDGGPDVFRQPVGVGRARLAQHHGGVQVLDAVPVLDAEDGGLRHVGMGQEGVLHRHRMDLDAVGLEHLADPTAQVEVAVAVDEAEVTGVHPAVPYGPGGEFGLGHVLAHREGRLYADLADLAGRQVVVVVRIGDPDPAGQRPADRDPQPGVEVLGGREHADEARLAGRVHLDQYVAEDLDRLGQSLGGGGATHVRDHLEAGQVGPAHLRTVHQQVQLGRGEQHPGDPVPLDGAQHVARVEAVLQDHRAAGRERVVGRGAAGVAEREEGQVDGPPAHLESGGDEAVAGPEVEGDALRFAGRTAGVGHHRGPVESDLDVGRIQRVRVPGRQVQDVGAEIAEGDEREGAAQSLAQLAGGREVLRVDGQVRRTGLPEDLELGAGGQVVRRVDGVGGVQMDHGGPDQVRGVPQDQGRGGVGDGQDGDHGPAAPAGLPVQGLRGRPDQGGKLRRGQRPVAPGQDHFLRFCGDYVEDLADIRFVRRHRKLQRCRFEEFRHSLQQAKQVYQGLELRKQRHADFSLSQSAPSK